MVDLVSGRRFRVNEGRWWFGLEVPTDDGCSWHSHDTGTVQGAHPGVCGFGVLLHGSAGEADNAVTVMSPHEKGRLKCQWNMWIGLPA